MGETGYAVVTTAENAAISGSKGEVLSVYQGLDRGPWQGVDDLFFAGKLSADLVSIRKTTRRNYVGNYSPGTTASLDEAIQLLHAGEAYEDRLEIIKIALIGTQDDLIQTSQVEGGIDCYVDGFGSLLRLGLYCKPAAFKEFLGRLNPFGSFDTPSTFGEYLAAYRNATVLENLEPIDDWSALCFYSVISIR